MGSTSEYEFDGFGNSLNGVNPTSAAGGDFGFHAAWREGATGLYHMRARAYDPLTGRFLTPDPAEPNPQVPETFEPYSFANNNPHLYSDPTGLFSLVEINVSNSIQSSLRAVKQVSIRQVRNELTERVEEFAVDTIIRTIQRLIPGFKHVNLDALDDIAAQGLSARLGSQFQDFVEHIICNAIGGSVGIHEYFWIEPVVERDGDVAHSGLNCQNLGAALDYLKDPKLRFTPRPDYIISRNDPQEGGTWLIGDMTLSGNGLYRKYVSPGRQQGQWDAITNHASIHGINVSLFMTFRKGSDATYRALSAKLGESGFQKGVLVYVLALINK